MGYNADYFNSHTANWLEKGWLPRGGRLIEFGGQEFYGDQGAARRRVRTFLTDQRVSEEAIETVTSTGQPLLVASIYRSIGIDYHSTDVDRAYGAEYFDLNTFATPLHLRAAFDFVNNEGTIEHLINPINGFHVAHELLKVGGVARHSAPLTGHRDHGMVYPTIKFYTTLLGENRYELLDGSISITSSPLEFCDDRFELRHGDGTPLEDASRHTLTDAWIQIIYRKTRPDAFRIPTDHLQLSPDVRAQAAQLASNFQVLAETRLGKDAVRGTDATRFEEAAELQRRAQEHDRSMANTRFSVMDRHANALVRSIDTLSERPFRPKPTLPATSLLCAVSNAAALFLRPQPHAATFAAGFFIATISTLVSIPNSPDPKARIIRHGIRALWLISAALFAIGMLP